MKKRNRFGNLDYDVEIVQGRGSRITWIDGPPRAGTRVIGTFNETGIIVDIDDIGKLIVEGTDGFQSAYWPQDLTYGK